MGDQTAYLPFNLRIHPQTLEVSFQHTHNLRMATRVSLPIGIGIQAMHQYFGDMLHRLQPMGLDHSPEHILRRHRIERLVKATKRTQRIHVECQQTAYIGHAAHQIQVEVRLEDRACRREGVMTTFVAVQAGAICTQCHALSHDHQGVLMQTVARSQQVDPLSLVIAGQPMVDLGEVIPPADDMLCIGRQGTHGRRSNDQDLAGGIGLPSQAAQSDAQRVVIVLIAKDHRHDAGQAGPLLDALGQQTQLSWGQFSAIQPLSIQIGKIETIGTHLLIEVA
ncbi:hypothetical protein D3C75_812630 [compost metagenome]